MAVFLELVTDAFEDVFTAQIADGQSAGGARSSRAGRSMARRPVRGIEVKDDTYAYLKVIRSNGSELPLLDSSSPSGASSKGYTNFILQQVQEQRMEKHQIVETFGDSYVFFFGESPRFLDCTAMLINTHDFNWRAEWWHNYENYLRGTKLVELGARCYMFWDDIVVEGYILNAGASEISDQPYTVTMQFKFFVTKYQNISLINVEQFPIRSSVVLPEGVELTDADAFDKLQAMYRGFTYGTRAQDAALRSQPALLSDLSQSLPPANRITQKIRQLPASMVTDPQVWNQLTGLVGTAYPDDGQVYALSGPRGGQLRGLIAENIDEYVGGTGPLESVNSYPDTAEVGQLPSSLLLDQETPSFEEDVIQTLESIGADADNDRCLIDLGLGPNFSTGFRAQSGIGLGVGASTSFGGSLSSGASISFGVVQSASMSIGASARTGFSADTSIGTSVGSNYDSQDPLGNLYGRTSGTSESFSADKRQLVEGAGDYDYGYNSAYGGVGYGKAGYGDFGGTGYGGCSSEGDPGYLDPELFDYNGVGEESDAFDAWNRPRQDQTDLTSGGVLGGVSVLGGASIHIGGVSTAFSLVAFDGDLEDWVVEASEEEEYGDIGGALVYHSRSESTVVEAPGVFGASASYSIGL